MHRRNDLSVRGFILKTNANDCIISILCQMFKDILDQKSKYGVLIFKEVYFYKVLVFKKR